MASATIEVVVVWDQDGDYGLGRDEETARANYESDVGELGEARGLRMASIVLSVPLPTMIELEAEVPETEEDPTLVIK